MNIMFYPHERNDEYKTDSLNTRWPVMSTFDGDLEKCHIYLQRRGLDPSVADANRWYPSRDAGDEVLRLVMPALTRRSDHVYWQARAITESCIRYQSPKGSRHGALIIVCAVQNEETKTVVVVEGPMDALAVAECGYDAIAIMGINPGAEAVEHLQKLLQNKFVIIVFDNEPKAIAAAQILSMHIASARIQVRVASPMRQKDLADIPFLVRKRWLNANEYGGKCLKSEL